MKDLLKKYGEQILTDPEKMISTALYVAALIVGAFAAWWVVHLVTRRLEKRVKDRPVFEKNRQIFAIVRRAGHYLILFLLGMAVLRLVQAPTVSKVFYAMMILLLCSFAHALAKILVPYMEDRLAARTHTTVDDVILSLSEKFSGVIIYATGIVLALDVLGLNIMPFVAGAGVAGIAIGFAAKDTLSNLIAGILLIIDRPFEVGDRIEVWSAPANSATWGDVIDIGLRATKIRTTDNIVIVIPNNVIMTRDIINYTTIKDDIRVRIPIGISYDADVKKAKELITSVSLEMDWVLRDPKPMVVVKSFGDSAVNLEARVWIRDPRKRIHTISHITDRVKEVFQEQGIEIPYPKRDIFIKREA
jgi:small-conductance mechanosensitive channel